MLYLFCSKERKMQKEKLQEILLDQRESFLRERYIINRDINLEPYISTSQVVIISGVRRCGKSTLLYSIKQIMQIPNSKFCYCNFDDERIIPENDILEQIYRTHIEMFNEEPIFFFDEIQTIPLWEKFVNRMHEKGNKLFVTGSNSTLLSSEIGTSLTGRNKILQLFPFSFKEFCRFKQHSYNIAQLSTTEKSRLLYDLHSYMEIGGFPIVVKENDIEIIHNWFQDILYRDIISRFKILQHVEIKILALFLISNTSKIFSYATLQKISHIKSLSSIKNYLHYFELSYMFFYVKKFDFSVQKQISNSKKVYSIDTALCNKLGFKFSENKGRLLENMVFLELLRQKKEIYYYANNKECDFIVKQGIQIEQAIQVVYELNQENYERELQGLLYAMNDLHISNGLIITFDDNTFPLNIPEHVTCICIWRWFFTF